MISVAEALSGNFTGQLVALRGWVHRNRSSGALAFPQLRDSTGVIQCLVRKGQLPDDHFAAAEKVLPESAVTLEGTVRQDPRAPGGYEVGVSAFTVINAVDPERPYPLRGDEGDDFLLDHRHLWVRSRPLTAALKVRARTFRAIHQFFEQEAFTEVQSPTFVSGACEGGSTLFKVAYWGDEEGPEGGGKQEVFLTQSWQLYAEAMVLALERIYTMAPSFRAERSRTRRHLTEFWHCEAEVAWAGNEQVMDLEERLVTHVVRQCLDHCPQELTLLGRDLEELRKVRLPFPRYRYEDAVALAVSKGAQMELGEDFTYSIEKVLTGDLSVPIFVTHFPTSIKPFYHRPDPADPAHVLCNDLLAPAGYGEIVGAGERCWNLEELMPRISAEVPDLAPYQWYLDLRRYGGVPHSGFGLGVDRLVAWICGADHIKQVIPFPRMMRRVYP